jgi:hypothetical protein
MAAGVCCPLRAAARAPIFEHSPMPQVSDCHAPLIAYRCRDGSYLLAPSNAPILADDEDDALTYLGEMGCDSFDDDLRRSLRQQFATHAYASVSREQFFAIGGADEQSVR